MRQHNNDCVNLCAEPHCTLISNLNSPVHTANFNHCHALLIDDARPHAHNSGATRQFIDFQRSFLMTHFIVATGII
jgi:hypothetical protein